MVLGLHPVHLIGWQASIRDSNIEGYLHKVCYFCNIFFYVWCMYRIKKNEYHVPSRVGPLARNLIQRLLQHDPAKRPSVAEILRDDFMTMGYLPPRLPVSCLTMAPRFDTKNNASLIARRTPLMEVNKESGMGSQGSLSRKDSATNDAGPSDCHLSELQKQLAVAGIRQWRMRQRVPKPSP